MITYRSVQLRGDSYCLDLVKGLHEPSEVRGRDMVAPGRVGRYVGNRIHDIRDLLIEGYIRGVGETEDDRQEDFHTICQTILDTMDRSLSPGALVIDGGDYGLPDGETWTINARCVDAMAGPMRNRWSYQEWSFKLESLDPEWQVAGS